MKALSSEARESGRASIESILAVAGAQHWSEEAIEVHMAKELAAAPPPGALWLYFPLMQSINRGLYFFSGDTRFFSLGLASIAAICMVVAVMVSLMTIQSVWNTATLSMLACTLLCLSYAGCMTIVRKVTYTIGKLKIRPPAQWQAYSYHEYRGHLPPLALSIAGAALQLGCTNIRVHALIQEDVELDPILEIDGHYCLVWDKDGNIIPPPA